MNEQNQRNTKSPYNENPNEEQKKKDNRLQPNLRRHAILSCPNERKKNKETGKVTMRKRMKNKRPKNPLQNQILW